MSLSTAVLATLAQVKCYLGITDESSDAVLEALIERATGFLERYCNRKLKTRSYTREVYYGNGGRHLFLDQYPATTISRVSIGRTNGFSIKNTTATNHATIEITSTALKYSADGAAATGLTLASYATINLLITALNAVPGWTATLLNSSLGTRKATDLLIRPAMYCKSPTVAYCEIPDDELTDYLLLSPSEDRNYGVLYNPSGWTRGEEYFVDYTAGYTTVPYALEEACILLVKYRYDQRDTSTGLSGETLGDYSWTGRDLQNAVPDDLRAMIDLYRKRTI
jgi:hypothetical protein